MISAIDDILIMEGNGFDDVGVVEGTQDLPFVEEVLAFHLMLVCVVSLGLTERIVMEYGLVYNLLRKK